MENALLLALNVLLCTLAVLFPICPAYAFIRWVNFKFSKPITVYTHGNEKEIIDVSPTPKVNTQPPKATSKEDIPSVKFKKPKVETHLNLD